MPSTKATTSFEAEALALTRTSSAGGKGLALRPATTSASSGKFRRNLSNASSAETSLTLSTNAGRAISWRMASTVPAGSLASR